MIKPSNYKTISYKQKISDKIKNNLNKYDINIASIGKNDKKLKFIQTKTHKIKNTTVILVLK